MAVAHALVLNASFEPIHVVSWKRAIQLLFQGKVEVVEESDKEIRTVRLSFKLPSVLRLLNYVHLRRQKDIIRFSRSNIFVRDGNQCQYCGKVYTRTLLTLDHVNPIVQGGNKEWENIVTCCRLCNQKKGGRTPKQAGMKLIKKPSVPNWLPQSHFRIGKSFVPERWKIYLSHGYNGNEIQINVKFKLEPD